MKKSIIFKFYWECCNKFLTETIEVFTW